MRVANSALVAPSWRPLPRTSWQGAIAHAAILGPDASGAGWVHPSFGVLVLKSEDGDRRP